MVYSLYKRHLTYLLVLIAIWFAVTLALALSGTFIGIGAMQIAAHIGLSIAMPMLLYYTWPPFKNLINEITPYGLAYFHVWRIFAALLFFYHAQQLPPMFVERAAWGDLIAGILAIIVYLLPKRSYLIFGFHFFGLLDLILAVGTGMYLTLILDPQMSIITHLPLVLIPLLGVPLSAISHLMAFDIWINKQIKNRHRSKNLA